MVGRIYRRALTLARNPALRPIEVWAIRAAVAYIAVKLGIATRDVIAH